MKGNYKHERLMAWSIFVFIPCILLSVLVYFLPTGTIPIIEPTGIYNWKVAYSIAEGVLLLIMVYGLLASILFIGGLLGLFRK